jgi:hypothetical protein
MLKNLEFGFKKSIFAESFPLYTIINVNACCQVRKLGPKEENGPKQSVPGLAQRRGPGHPAAGRPGRAGQGRLHHPHGAPLPQNHALEARRNQAAAPAAPPPPPPPPSPPPPPTQKRDAARPERALVADDAAPAPPIQRPAPAAPRDHGGAAAGTDVPRAQLRATPAGEGEAVVRGTDPDAVARQRRHLFLQQVGVRSGNAQHQGHVPVRCVRHQEHEGTDTAQISIF